MDDFKKGDMKSTDGKWLTKALFWETRHEKYTPTFTLQEQDREENGTTYPSLKRIFLEYSDPTEYEFAKEVIGSWKHWEAMCKSYELKPHIKEWRDELEIMMKSRALKAMMNTAINEGSKGTAAAKYIAEKGWEKKAGRPTNAEKERQAKIESGVNSQIKDDAERLGLH